jgi:hypothetical protein
MGFNREGTDEFVETCRLWIVATALLLVDSNPIFSGQHSTHSSSTAVLLYVPIQTHRGFHTVVAYPMMDFLCKE